MTKESRGGLEEVAALMLERQRLESWLASLDARRAATPDDVFHRVRGDYAARLKAVTDQLLQRRAAILKHLETLTARLSQLEVDAQRLKDQRAEAELRMQVGELNVTDGKAKIRESDEMITRFNEAQTQLQSLIAQARGLLATVSTQTGNGGLPARSPTPRPTRPLTIEQEQEAEAAAKNIGGLRGSGGRAAIKSPGSQPSMDELEFLNSVVGGESSDTPTVPPTPSRPGPRAPAAPPPPPPHTANVEGDGAPDLGESLLNRINQRQSTSNLREDVDAESLLNSKGPKPAGPKPSPLAANVTDANPIVLRPQGGLERHKTLKCNECGTMNYPTEWYCERCGGELAAL
jgi:hypothetical protein